MTRRTLRTLLIGVVLLCAACGGSDSSASAAEGDAPVPTSAPQPTSAPAAAPPESQIQQSPPPAPELLEPTPTVGGVTTGETDDVPSPNVTRPVVSTSDEKSQPVFRQARSDGDSREQPVTLAVVGGEAQTSGELSAFTDREDWFVLASGQSGSDLAEIALSWACVEIKSEDGQSMRIAIEQAGGTVAEFACNETARQGSATITLAAGDALISTDITRGDGSAANMFVAYELDVRAILSVDADADADADAEVEGDLEDEDEAEAGATPTAVPEVGATPESTATPTPTVSQSPQPAPEPEPTSPPEPTLPPESTPEAEPTAEPTPTPEPPVVSIVTNSVVAPDDGDSRTNPASLDDDGFLIGAVSAPNGDQADWSTFTVSDGDPIELFAGVRCDTFVTETGTGMLQLTVFDGDRTVATVRCTTDQLEDFAQLSLRTGATYVVQAEFIGVGYAEWSFEAEEDE